MPPLRHYFIDISICRLRHAIDFHFMPLFSLLSYAISIASHCRLAARYAYAAMRTAAELPAFTLRHFDIIIAMSHYRRRALPDAFSQQSLR